MEQTFKLDDAQQKDFLRIDKRLKNTNFPEDLSARVLEAMAAGQKEFTVRTTEPVASVPEPMFVTLIIGPANKDKTMTVLQAIEVELSVAPHIPNINIKDGDKVLLNTLDLDDKITKAYANGIMFPGTDARRQAALTEFTDAVSKDMQLLMKEQPDTFNRFVVKHTPPLNFDIPTDLQQQQARMIDANHIQRTFSSYHNLSPIEMYGMLKNGLPVKKLLFEEGQQVTKWLRLTDEVDALGRAKIRPVKTGDDNSILTALKQYNFLELKNQTGLDQVARILEKGNLHMVTNGNDKGEPYVYIGANPGYDMRIVMYTLDRAPIRYHNQYLKNPINKTMGVVPSLPTSTQQKRFGENYVEGQRRATGKPKDHTVGAPPVEETATKKKKGRGQIPEDKTSKKKTRR